jgi:hypothetical protein
MAHKNITSSPTRGSVIIHAKIRTHLSHAEFRSSLSLSLACFRPCLSSPPFYAPVIIAWRSNEKCQIETRSNLSLTDFF